MIEKLNGINYKSTFIVNVHTFFCLYDNSHLYLFFHLLNKFHEHAHFLTVHSGFRSFFFFSFPFLVLHVFFQEIYNFRRITTSTLLFIFRGLNRFLFFVIIVVDLINFFIVNDNFINLSFVTRTSI